MKTLAFSLFAIGLAFYFVGENAVTPARGGQQEPAAKKTPPEILKLFVEECVSITPGTEPFPEKFSMGGPLDGPLAAPPREVAMKAAFRISRYEVTQELYRAVMGVNPSRWKGERNSVEMVSFQDAEQFCIRLSGMLQAARLITAKDNVRLPNEAEWEYCCRAGTATRFSFGDSATVDGDQENAAGALNEFAWHTGNAAGNDPVVGALKPNPWGLYDMHGYLWEFVSSPYMAAPGVNEANPLLPDAPASNAARIIRGGSWRDHHSLLTSHSRLVLPAHAASDAVGFRCVIETSP